MKLRSRRLGLSIAIPAGPLPGTPCDVGKFVAATSTQRLAVLAGPQLRHSEACRHQLRKGLDELCRERHAHALGHHPGLREIGVGHQHGEFLASVAGNEVRRPALRAQQCGQCPQHLVSPAPCPKRSLTRLK